MVTAARGMTERSKVKVGPAPHGHVGYSEALDRVWVLNSGARTISVLDGGSGGLDRKIDVGGSPRHVIIDDDAGLAFVAVDDAVVMGDAKGRRVSKRLPLKAGRATCLLPMLPRKRMYVLGDAGTMTIVDTERQEIAGTLPTGRGSNWGQPHENSCGKLYITNAATDDLTIIDEATDRVIPTAPAGRPPPRNATFREHG